MAMTGDPVDAASAQQLGLVNHVVPGATAVQCIPHLARDAGELYVFQRTPSSVDVRGNQPTDPEWFASIAEPGWQKRWLENFTVDTMGGFGSAYDEDLVRDGWTDISQRVKTKIEERVAAEGEFTADTLVEAFEDADFEKMEEIRSRVDAIVEDQTTADGLKAWYGQLCASAPASTTTTSKRSIGQESPWSTPTVRASNGSLNGAWSSRAASTRSTASCGSPDSKSGPASPRGPASI